VIPSGMIITMKSIPVAAAAVCSVVCLAWTPHAEAAGARGIDADLPCPYGGAGAPNANAWSPIAGSGPFNPGLVTPNAATLASGSGITQDQASLAIVSAVQYVYYSSPIPPASACSPDPFTVNPNGPLEQVMTWTMDNNASVSQAGDVEVEFNYNTFFDPALATTAGTASFTMGGVTYTSSGTFLPTSTDNDFLFSSTGALKGEIVTDVTGTASLKAGVPDGWTIKSGGGGGGTVPEIDPASAVAGFTLLAGVLAVLRSGRRTPRVAR
jgi:hypothetical protein